MVLYGLEEADEVRRGRHGATRVGVRGVKAGLRAQDGGGSEGPDMHLRILKTRRMAVF